MGIKVLHLSSFDISGGAARAANRVHQSLQKIGVDSQMLVQFSSSDDRTVVRLENKVKARLRSSLDSLIWKVNTPAQHMFSPQWFPDAIASKVAHLNPDIINLHWVCNGYLQIETLQRLNRPLVWTLHDMWAFTGGCHYDESCGRYTESCGACPQLKSDRDRDLSYWIWQRKMKAWKGLDLTLVTPSRWLAQCTRASSLFRDQRIEVISNGVDLKCYKPINRRVARDLLNLPQDKQIILFGSMTASDSRKGFQFLQPALKRLSQSKCNDQIELMVLGASQSDISIDLGFTTHYLGRLNDDVSLALVYAAADIFAAPSVQDNLPNTVVEALACGIPCIAFNIGGMPDMIDHQQNGYLAKPFDVEDLAQGIVWILKDAERHQKLCYGAREKAEQEFSLELQAKRYVDLYNKVLGQYLKERSFDDVAS